MRALVVLVVLVGLASCAPRSPGGHVFVPPRPPGPPTPSVPVPEWATRTGPETPEERQRRDQRLNEQAAAEAICAARGEAAGATYAGRGFGLVGALAAGSEAAIAAERVRAACLRAYQTTGVVPTL